MSRATPVEGIDYAPLTVGDIAVMRAAMVRATEVDLRSLYIEEEDVD